MLRYWTNLCSRAWYSPATGDAHRALISVILKLLSRMTPSPNGIVDEMPIDVPGMCMCWCRPANPLAIFCRLCVLPCARLYSIGMRVDARDTSYHRIRSKGIPQLLFLLFFRIIMSQSILWVDIFPPIKRKNYCMLQRIDNDTLIAFCRIQMAWSVYKLCRT